MWVRVPVLNSLWVSAAPEARCPTHMAEESPSWRGRGLRSELAGESAIAFCLAEEEREGKVTANDLSYCAHHLSRAVGLPNHTVTEKVSPLSTGAM